MPQQYVIAYDNGKARRLLSIRESKRGDTYIALPTCRNFEDAQFGNIPLKNQKISIHVSANAIAGEKYIKYEAEVEHPEVASISTMLKSDALRNDAHQFVYSGMLPASDGGDEYKVGKKHVLRKIEVPDYGALFYVIVVSSKSAEDLSASLFDPFNKIEVSLKEWNLTILYTYMLGAAGPDAFMKTLATNPIHYDGEPVSTPFNGNSKGWKQEELAKSLNFNLCHTAELRYKSLWDDLYETFSLTIDSSHVLGIRKKYEVIVRPLMAFVFSGFGPFSQITYGTYHGQTEWIAGHENGFFEFVKNVGFLNPGYLEKPSIDLRRYPNFLG